MVEGTAKGILSSMPRAWDMPFIRKNLGDRISPTQVVLLQELERYNQVGLHHDQFILDQFLHI